MSDHTLDKLPGGFKGMATDMGSDQTVFKGELGKGNDVDLFTQRYIYF
jgi:hypothetical protein